MATIALSTSPSCRSTGADSPSSPSRMSSSSSGIIGNGDAGALANACSDVFNFLQLENVALPTRLDLGSGLEKEATEPRPSGVGFESIAPLLWHIMLNVLPAFLLIRGLTVVIWYCLILSSKRSMIYCLEKESSRSEQHYKIVMLAIGRQLIRGDMHL